MGDRATEMLQPKRSESPDFSLFLGGKLFSVLDFHLEVTTTEHNGTFTLFTAMCV